MAISFTSQNCPKCGKPLSPVYSSEGIPTIFAKCSDGHQFTEEQFRKEMESINAGYG